jgi:two-component system LytT family sensor kinase
MSNAPSLDSIEVSDKLADRRKWRLLGLLWGCFWVLMVIIAVQERLNQPSILWWEPLLWEGTSAIAATVWLTVQLRAARDAKRLLDQPFRWFVRHLKWFPLVAVLFIAAIYSMRHAVYTAVGVDYEHESWGFLLIQETVKVWLFLGLWLGIIFALESFSLWEAQRHRLALLQKSLAEAQLGQLKAQLRPHFLFNALNTISSLMHVDVARADRLLAQVAELLRASLRMDQEELAPFATELDIARLYARIMEERFEGRVALEWRIDDRALDALVPTMILQPLLENAFKHGVERANVPAHIVVAAERAQDDFVLRRSTTGEISPSPGVGVGLRNCRARLQAHFGERGRVEFASDERSAEVRIQIPWKDRVT